MADSIFSKKNGFEVPILNVVVFNLLLTLCELLNDSHVNQWDY